MQIATIPNHACGTRIASEIPVAPDCRDKGIMFMGAALGKFHILEWEPFQEKWLREMRPCFQATEQCLCD